MGMGDKKYASHKAQAPQKCSKCGYVFDGVMVSSCPHPAVQRVYGKYICLYCCRKCKHSQQPKNVYGVFCVYQKEG